MPLSEPIAPEQEAARLLLIYHDLAKCLDIMSHEFGVIQNRTQLLLTLATLTLTITGFSGPKIAQSGVFSRYTMIIGMALAQIAILITLAGTFKIRWLGQFQEESDAATLAAIIRYRNFKTFLYRLEITVLIVGLTFYVASLTAYFITG
jgi:hypothetical protein